LNEDVNHFGSSFCFQFWGSKGVRQMGALIMFQLFMLGNCKWDVTSYFIRHNESTYVRSSRCSFQQSKAYAPGRTTPWFVFTNNYNYLRKRQNYKPEQHITLFQGQIAVLSE